MARILLVPTLAMFASPVRASLPAALVVSAVLALATRPAFAQESLEVSFNTTPAGGPYAPDNIVAVWIENDTGEFVRTIGRWARTRINHLVAWSAASGQDADAVSGATRSDHTQRLTVSWDMLDRNGMPVPNGTYTIRMELADSNASRPDQNNQGTFTFVLDGQDSSQTGSDGGFENVTVAYSGVDAASCGNDSVDTGETCDPPESCPTSCPAAAAACIANTLVGSAAACTAECVERPIDACADGDGCCPTGCTSATDSDCSADDAPAGQSYDLEGAGCSASARTGRTGGGLLIICVIAAGVALYRQRRRSERARRLAGTSGRSQPPQ